jgi:hypothetical protein
MQFSQLLDHDQMEKECALRMCRDRAEKGLGLGGFGRRGGGVHFSPQNNYETLFKSRPERES